MFLINTKAKPITMKRLFFIISILLPLTAMAQNNWERPADAAPSIVTVVLTSFGEAKTAVIKVVKEITGLGLVEAKGVVDKCPSPIKENISVDEAEDIKAKLEESAVKQADAVFENAIMEALINKVDAPIPNCMFEQRITALMRDFQQQLQSQGMDIKMYYQFTGMNEDTMRDTYRDRAVGEVKLRLALEKIAEIEKLEVTEEEINNGLSEIAAANNIDVEMVKRFIPIEDYKNDMLVQKAVELVKDNAVVDNSAEEKAE